MGLSLVAYLVDTSDLRRIFGSKDAQLAADLQRTLHEDGRWDDEEVAQAIQDFVFGGVLNVSLAEEYAAALEILCLRFGKRLQGEAFAGMQPIATTLLRRFDGLLNQTPIPLPIPSPKSTGFPTPFYISHATAQAILTRLDAVIAPVDDPLAGEWVADAQEEYRSWLTAAAAQSEDLFIFLS